MSYYEDIIDVKPAALVAMSMIRVFFLMQGFSTGDPQRVFRWATQR